MVFANKPGQTMVLPDIMVVHNISEKIYNPATKL
jgi:hypothetical protein